ncbi:MAG: ABC transporter permease [Actinobacteria bacterium]|nr:ABC transporter permease [Actinomycetota bacterium]MDI6831683.1 ABC transporter permease [Actinomycetota bacterium]
MSARRIAAMMRKSMNPRNPYIIFALLGPLIYAAVFQLVFSIWETRPRVAVYEEGDAAVTRELEAVEAVDALVVDSPEEVKRAVESKRADAGVVLDGGAKEKVFAGERTPVELYIGGESLAKNRVIATAAITAALRAVSPGVPRVDFEVIRLGEEKALSAMEIFLPFVVIYVILLGGLMLTSSSLVNEKERKTLAALLVTPVTLSEIMLAFGAVGVTVSLVMGAVLVLLTTGLSQPALMLTVFVLGSLLAAEWGLLLGFLSRDQTTLVAYIKAFGIFLIAPALFIVNPSWPQWIAKIFPTYYIANPIFRAAIYGEGWREVGWQVLVLLGLTLLFLFPLTAFERGQIFDLR